MTESSLRKALLALFAVSLCLSIAIQQTVLGLLLAFLAYLCWRNRSLPRTSLDRPILLFLGALLFSTLFCLDFFTSLSGYRKLWLLGAFWVTYHLVEEPAEVERLVSLIVVVATLVAAYGIVQHFTGLDLARQLLGKESNLDLFWLGQQEGFRTKGLHPSGITYAHNLLFPLAFVSALCSAPGLQWRRWLALLGGWGLMVFALLFSLTRGVWIAYMAVLFLLGVIRGGRTLLGAVIGSVVLGLFLLGAGPGVRERAVSILDLRENLGRSRIWQANLDMIKERPLLGWGYGNYKKFRGPYYQRYPQADTMAHAHNNFLQIAVAGGLLGLGAFIYLFWAILRKGWQAYRFLPAAAEPLRSMVLGGVLGVVGFLLGGLTQYNFGDAEVAIMLWATVGVLARAEESTERQRAKAVPPLRRTDRDKGQK
jgi:O-antigen ligase